MMVAAVLVAMPWLLAPGFATAGPNAGGHLLLHTEESVSYTWDDVSSYAGFTIPECPWRECFDPAYECEEFLLDIDVSSNKPYDEPAVFWVIAAFPSHACPRVNAVAFGIDWDVTGNEPTFVGWGNCADWELSVNDWPLEPHSGTVAAFSQPRPQLATPIYWFAAFAYYGESTINLTSHPTEGVARFADDSIPSKLDTITRERLGSMGLGGAGGVNSFYPDNNPVIEGSWGGVKAQFRESGDR